MIIYLYGPDAYRRQRKLKEIITEYRKRHADFTAERFYLNDVEDDWERFKKFIYAQSLFGNSRLAIVYGLGEIKEKDAVGVIELLVKKQDVVLLLSEEKQLAKNFAFLLKKPVVSQKFDNLTNGEFKSFVASEAKARGIGLSNLDLDAYARLYIEDTWGAITELDKLSLSNSNFKFQISNFKSSLNGSIFNLIFSLRSPNLKQRLSVLEGLLKQEDAAKIFNLLAYSNPQKNKFADYDAAVKSGKLDYETALTDFVLSF